MAILRAAVNLHERTRGENRRREGGRKEGRGCAEGVTADLRLIKVNKPFSLLLSWHLKTEIHGCINYFTERERRGGWKREALNGAQPPPSGRHNRPTYFQIKGSDPGSPGCSRCDFKWRICRGVCLFRDLLRPTSRYFIPRVEHRLTRKTLREISHPANCIDADRSDPFDACRRSKVRT